MDYGHLTRKYEKQQPGADLVFQPADIGDYANDEWDIRISIGDAPLDEAYYFTVDDPEAVHQPIEKLLENYALNPAMRDRLDIQEYPDLPFLQEELRQYWENGKKKSIDLNFYINNNPMSGPVNLGLSADMFLSVCTYHDGSYDYRLLDLVLDARVPEADAFEADRMRRRFSNMFLLMLLDYHREGGPEAYNQFLNEKEVRELLNGMPCYTCNEFFDGMKALETANLITISYGDGKNFARDESQNNPIELTDAGEAFLAELKQNFCDVADLYDCFDSVAIAPPALGVPGGFDARIQMMEYDGLDCEETVMLQVLGQGRDEYFSIGQWQEALHKFTPSQTMLEALAYKTNFTAEVLAQLKQLAESGQ